MPESIAASDTPNRMLWVNFAVKLIMAENARTEAFKARAV
jgi:hypothetical protein